MDDSSTVVDLAAEREKRTPHMHGAQICLACGHVEEHVVAPIGVTEFECSACGLMRAVWRWPLSPQEHELIWKCICGGEHFYLRAEGAPMCATCGLAADRYEEGRG